MAALTTSILVHSQSPLPDGLLPGCVLQLTCQSDSLPSRIAQLTGLAMLTRAGREGHVSASVMLYRNPDTAAQLSRETRLSDAAVAVLRMSQEW